MTYAALVLGLYGTAEANLITNGSFEDVYNTYNSSAPFVTLTTGSTKLTGWSVGIPDDPPISIDWIGLYWKASQGDKSIDLAGYYTQGLIIGTEFATEIGKTYRVQFDMAGNPDKGYDKFLVAAAISGGAGNSQSFTFLQAGHTSQNMGWETKYFDFIAGDILTQLSFGDQTGRADNAWGAALDNVIVELAPVPEPSTLLLLGAGFAGVGLFGRKYQKFRKD